MSKVKKISSKERLEIYENFISRLHFVRHVAGNERKVLEMLSVADAVAVSFGSRNAVGQPLTEEQIATNVNAALQLMKDAS